MHTSRVLISIAEAHSAQSCHTDTSCAVALAESVFVPVAQASLTGLHSRRPASADELGSTLALLLPVTGRGLHRRPHVDAQHGRREQLSRCTVITAFFDGQNARLTPSASHPFRRPQADRSGANASSSPPCRAAPVVARPVQTLAHSCSQTTGRRRGSSCADNRRHPADAAALEPYCASHARLSAREGGHSTVALGEEPGWSIPTRGNASAVTFLRAQAPAGFARQLALQYAFFMPPAHRRCTSQANTNPAAAAGVPRAVHRDRGQFAAPEPPTWRDHAEILQQGASAYKH